MVKEKQDFPMMIYHIILGNKIVKDQEELDAAEKGGWTKNYTVISERADLQEKKRMLEYDLALVNAKLSKMEPDKVEEPKRKGRPRKVL